MKPEHLEAIAELNRNRDVLSPEERQAVDRLVAKAGVPKTPPAIQATVLPSLPKPEPKMKRVHVSPVETFGNAVNRGGASAAAGVDRIAANAVGLVTRGTAKPPASPEEMTGIERGLRDRAASLNKAVADYDDAYDTSLDPTARIAGNIAGGAMIDVPKYAIGARAAAGLGPIAGDAVSQGAIDALEHADEGYESALKHGAIGAGTGAAIGRLGRYKLPVRAAGGAAVQGGAAALQGADAAGIGVAALAGAATGAITKTPGKDAPPPPKPKQDPPTLQPAPAPQPGMPPPPPPPLGHTGVAGDVPIVGRQAPPRTQRDVVPELVYGFQQPGFKSARDSAEVFAAHPEPPPPPPPPPAKAQIPPKPVKSAQESAEVFGEHYTAAESAKNFEELLGEQDAVAAEARQHARAKSRELLSDIKKNGRRQPPPEPDPTAGFRPQPGEEIHPADIAGVDGSPMPGLEPKRPAADAPGESPQWGAYHAEKNSIISRLEPIFNDAHAPTLVSKAKGRKAANAYTDAELDQLAAEISGGPIAVTQRKDGLWATPDGTLYRDKRKAVAGYVNQHIDDLMKKRGHDVAMPDAKIPPPEVSDDAIVQLLVARPELAEALKAEGVRGRQAMIDAIRQDIPHDELVGAIDRISKPKPQAEAAASAYMGSGLGAFQPYIERATNKLRSIFTRENAQGVKDKIEDGMIDRYGPVRRAFSELGINDSNPYVAIRNHAGVGGRAENRLNDLGEIVRGLDKQGNLADAIELSTFQRYKELLDRGITDLPGGLTAKQVDDRLADLGRRIDPAKRQQIDEALGRYRKYHDRRMQEAADSGLISKQALDELRKSNQMYVPLLRVMDDIDESAGLRGSKNYSVGGQSVIRHIEGSKREIIDPFESSIRQTVKLMDEIGRNNAARKIVDLAQPGSPFDTMIKPAVKGKSGYQVGRDEGLFNVMINGQRVAYTGPKALVDALNHADEIQMGAMGQVMSRMASLFRAGTTTMNIAFALPNWFRDQWSATINSTHHYNTLRDGLPAIGEAIMYQFLGRQQKNVREFLESGAGGSSRLDQFGKPAKTLKQLKRQGSAGDVAIKLINPKTYAESLELATRLGVYRRAKKATGDSTQAAFDARNATVDFAKAGNVGRAINMFVPFFNARLQGGLNTLNSLGEMLANPKKHANRWVAVASGGVLGTYLYQNNTGLHGEVWDRISDRDKSENFIYIYGNGKDEAGRFNQVIKIPKGEAFRALFDPIEAFWDQKRNHDPHAFRRAVMEGLSQFSPAEFSRKGELSGSLLASQMLPPGVKALAEGTSGYDFYRGRDIETQSEQARSPENRYDDNTPKAFRVIGQATGASPKRVQQVARDLTGSFAEYGAAAADGILGGEKTGAKLVDPVVRRFTRAYDSGDSDDFEMLAGSRREAADHRFAVDRVAGDILKAKPEDRAGILERAIAEGRVTDSDVDRLREKLTNPGGNDINSRLRAASAAEQASYLYAKLSRMPAEKRADFIAGLAAEEGLIKEDAVGRLADRLRKQPLD